MNMMLCVWCGVDVETDNVGLVVCSDEGSDEVRVKVGCDWASGAVETGPCGEAADVVRTGVTGAIDEALCRTWAGVVDP